MKEYKQGRHFRGSIPRLALPGTGKIKKTWIDENGNTCIMYQSGKWWHYNVDQKGNIIFW